MMKYFNMLDYVWNPTWDSSYSSSLNWANNIKNEFGLNRMAVNSSLPENILFALRSIGFVVFQVIK